MMFPLWQDFVEQQDEASKSFHEELARRKFEPRYSSQQVPESATGPDLIPSESSNPKPQPSLSVRHQRWADLGSADGEEKVSPPKPPPPLPASEASDKREVSSLPQPPPPLPARVASTSKMRSFTRSSYNSQVT